MSSIISGRFRAGQRIDVSAGKHEDRGGVKIP
jgi:hypothetical protein